MACIFGRPMENRFGKVTLYTEQRACEAPPSEREASGSPLEGGLKTAFGVLVLNFPLSRAEHRRGGRIKVRGLSERSEFPRAPSAAATRRIKRDTGVFFCFVFFHVEENEETH